MPKIMKVSGPPGCGKTTYLLSQIEKACHKYEPSRIGAISFTKAAVEEMRDRMKNVLGYSGKSSRNIRTIHSHGFRLLGLDKKDIVDGKNKHIKSWNEAFPRWALPVDGPGIELEDEPGIISYEQGNNVKIHQAMEILRNRSFPVDRWEISEPNGLGRAAALFWKDWSHFLEENGLWDFTKILEETKRLQLRPDIDVLFIDECQDLSRLQLDITRIWAEQCDSVIYIGDADQALYRFAGASPEDFRDLVHEWGNVLKQSYRVPKEVYDYAIKLIRKIKDREDVDYLPTDKAGRFLNADEYPKLELPGSHMILCRCNYHLKRWITYLIDKGIPWKNHYRLKNKAWNPASTKTWMAVKTYNQIKKGQEVIGEEIIRMIEKMTKEYLVRGVKTHRKKLIEESCGYYGSVDIFYLNSSGLFQPDFFNFKEPVGRVFNLTGYAGVLINRHGTKVVDQEPECTIGTTHSVKGGEADHVWVDLSTSYKIALAMQGSMVARADEIRVGYVACTRARETLGLLQGDRSSNHVFG